mmetsp:Transcript_18528/g.57473  ORF Transcript_18528/g.57473 Transcript_18528/m.57473 type:complete len:203 (-) Transcript_18528:172-780(-)
MGQPARPHTPRALWTLWPYVVSLPPVVPSPLLLLLGCSLFPASCAQIHFPLCAEHCALSTLIVTHDRTVVAWHTACLARDDLFPHDRCPLLCHCRAPPSDTPPGHDGDWHDACAPLIHPHTQRLRFPVVPDLGLATRFAILLLFVCVTIVFCEKSQSVIAPWRMPHEPCHRGATACFRRRLQRDRGAEVYVGRARHRAPPSL